MKGKVEELPAHWREGLEESGTHPQGRGPRKESNTQSGERIKWSDGRSSLLLNQMNR